MIWLRRLLWFATAILLFWLAAWLAIPPLLKWQVQARASEALGRNVTLGDMSFRPWNLDLTLNDLVVAGASASSPPLLQVGRLHANLSAASLFRLAPVVEALEVDALRLNLSRTDEGHYDIDDLLGHLAPRPDAASSEPARFALYNVQVRDGAMTFDDRPAGRIHRLEALQLTLPFISNLPTEVDIKVEPRLAFKLNGAPFDSGAQATPFAQTRSGDLNLKFTDLDLAPYLGYLPATSPVRVLRGSVSADIAAQFAVPRGAPPSLVLKGEAGATRVALTDVAGAPLVELQSLRLGLRDVQPLARRIALRGLRIEGLQLHATRDAGGNVNLLRLATSDVGATTAPPRAAEGASGASKSVTIGTVPAWQVSLDTFDLADARVQWRDAAVTPAAALQIDGLNIGARQIAWPLTGPIAVSVKGALRGSVEGAPALGVFAAEGPATDREVRLDLTLNNLALDAFAPYLAQSIAPTVEGRLGAKAQLDWAGSADAPRLKLNIATLTLDNLKVREGTGRAAQDAVAAKQLALADAKVDLLARGVALGDVKLTEPSVGLSRDRTGRLNVQAWMVEAQAGRAPGAAASASASASAPPGVWRVQLRDLQLEGGQVRFADALPRRGASGEPVRVDVTSLKLAVQGFEWQAGRALPPAAVQMSARVGAPTRDNAKRLATIEYKGRIGVQPLLASGRLMVKRLPVQLLAPYVADQVQLALLRAEAGYTGEVSLRALPGGFDVAAAGDVLLGDVHIATLPQPAAAANGTSTDELLSWQSLALKGFKFASTPDSRPQLEIAEAALTDFYARLVITEQGHLNLQDVAGAPAGKLPAAAATASAPPAPAASAPASVAAASAASGTTDSNKAAPLDIKVGKTVLTNGRVDFTDHFVRPNYSAALTDLNGQLGAYGSSSRAMATIDLRGRAAGTALLEISGQVNPTVKPLALDIRAKATDLELAPLSPYAGKYAGYAIERGKLSMDVAYKIEADGKLEASNKVVLNQLTFGDRIESKDATKLPVRLAIALLKDRNGVIDINLPVSGSVNDPQFSVGGIIWKVILNLLTRAITSPFSLLAGGSGGAGGDLSVVEFKPGTSQIGPAGVAAIDKIAKALNDRPTLKMTVAGAADPASEREAFQQATVETRLVAEQRREALRSGAPASSASMPVTLAADERTRLLTRVYKDSDLPDKPRNALGFAKDVPAPEMEALLKARVPVTDEGMRELALQRGIAVRDSLIAKGLPSERLFLAAPKLRVSGDDDAAWTPKVQLSLSAN